MSEEPQPILRIKIVWNGAMQQVLCCDAAISNLHTASHISLNFKEDLARY
jgi:hypothetical protein